MIKSLFYDFPVGDRVIRQDKIPYLFIFVLDIFYIIRMNDVNVP